MPHVAERRKVVGLVSLFGAALALALALALVVSPFASSLPDGLERVAHDLGFAAKAEETASPLAAPIPDYSLPGVTNGRLATALAGGIGTVAAFGAAALVGGILTVGIGRPPRAGVGRRSRTDAGTKAQ